MFRKDKHSLLENFLQGISCENWMGWYLTITTYVWNFCSFFFVLKISYCIWVCIIIRKFYILHTIEHNSFLEVNRNSTNVDPQSDDIQPKTWLLWNFIWYPLLLTWISRNHIYTKLTNIRYQIFLEFFASIILLMIEWKVDMFFM